MKKRYLIAILLVGIIIFILFYTFPPQPLISNAIFEQQNQGNKTEPFKFPFKLPWQATETTSNTTTGTIGSNATAGGGGEEKINETYFIPKYKLDINASIQNSEFFIIYTINNLTLNKTLKIPYTLEIDKDSIVCIATSLYENYSVIWYLDDDYCDDTCDIYLPEMYTCSFFMNNSHKIFINYSTEITW